jgi:hypothetical protein
LSASSEHRSITFVSRFQTHVPLPMRKWVFGRALNSTVRRFGNA